LVTYQNYTKMQVRKIVRQVGYLPELYEDARSENIKKYLNIIFYKKIARVPPVTDARCALATTSDLLRS